jgi:hypothetical protein
MCVIYFMSLISYDMFQAICPSSDNTICNLIWWHYYNLITYYRNDNPWFSIDWINKETEISNTL